MSMPDEVRHGVHQRTQNCHVEALNGSSRRQQIVRNVRDDANRRIHHTTQFCCKLFAGMRAVRLKFPLAVTVIGLHENSGNRPLPKIAGQMQQQVADGIQPVCGLPPDSGFIELRYAMHDPAV